MLGSSLLAAAALIAIPVIIHIFNRTRYRRINWAAMEFLLAAFRRTRRRVQMEHLLLLILRCLAMLFIALAFFPADVDKAVRSTLDWAGVSFTEGTDAGIARHMVLVLDDTASMQYRDGNRTSFERAIERASAIVGTLREGRDRVTLIRASAVHLSPDATLSEQENIQRLNREIPVYEPGRAVEVLAQARPGFGEADMLALMREAGRRVESMDPERERPQVIVLTDFQTRAWGFSSAADPQNQAWTQLMGMIASTLEPAGEQVRFVDVGPGVAANYSVTDVALETPVIGVGVAAQLRVTVGNFAAGSTLPDANIRLQYRINQGEARPFSQAIERIPPGTQVTVNQAIAPFDQVGPATIRVELVARDLLEIDNSRTLAVNVIDALPVLLVNGRATPAGGREETFELTRLLEIAGPGEDMGNTVTPNRISVIGPAEVEQRSANFSDFAVIVIVNAPTFSRRVSDRLDEYVRRGGTVILTVGDLVRPDDWNEHLWRGGKGILPAPLRAPAGATRDDPQAVLHSMRSVNFGPGTPFAYFGEREDWVKFLEFPKFIFRWMEVDTAARLEGGADVPGVRTLMAIDNDIRPPLFIERSSGRGRCVLYTSTIDGSWNYCWDGAALEQTIYAWQELVRATALGERGRMNLSVGQHFLRILREDEQTARGTRIQAPDGTTARPVDVALADGRSQLVYQQTAQPGVYRLQFLGETDGRESVTREEMFAVGLPGSEADVARLGGTPERRGDPQGSLKAGLGDIPFLFEASSDEGGEEARIGGAASRIDVWLLLVGMAALFLLLEMGLSVIVGRRSEQ